MSLLLPFFQLVESKRWRRESFHFTRTTIEKIAYDLSNGNIAIGLYKLTKDALHPGSSFEKDISNSFLSYINNSISWWLFVEDEFETRGRKTFSHPHPSPVVSIIVTFSGPPGCLIMLLFSYDHLAGIRNSKDCFNVLSISSAIACQEHWMVGIELTNQQDF